MGTSASPKRMRHSLLLPDDLMHLIFSKLEFQDKINAGLVCVDWNQLLKAGGAAARHWMVKYCVQEKDLRDFSITSRPISMNQSALFGRWLAGRAAAIKYVDLEVDLWDQKDFDQAQRFVESYLPLLAGALSGQVNVMGLTFVDVSPFASPLLSSPQFLSVLCPLVKELDLFFNTPLPVTVDQFAAICRLSNLEKLSICNGRLHQDGLQEMTSDISKLVNLRYLEIGASSELKSIPDAISCLQKLEQIEVSHSSITEVCAGLGRLANLLVLKLNNCKSLQFPHTLEGLGSLSSLQLQHCSLPAIPGVLSTLSALKKLYLTTNRFEDNPQWWPASLSRLTQLEVLWLGECGIQSLPPQLSALVRLKVSWLEISRGRYSNTPRDIGCCAQALLRMNNISC